MNQIHGAALGHPHSPRSHRLPPWCRAPAAVPHRSIALARLRYHPDEHDHQSRVFVADLRAVSARRGVDSEVRGLIRRLVSASCEFADLWAHQEVAVRRADRKRLMHPDLCAIELNCLSLLSEDGSQRLLWFTAPVGGDSAEKLELLAVLGSQDVGAAKQSGFTLR
ncbi:MmyB family transcriptional regulator [Streptomyces ardesiacus]|uniref:MmyB family transcriptional regulator n=1 Tax=Streptomyces ardesiacus TaxID=285564 RepID=UPI002481ACD9|nr:hypothetical protein [Streptomyces ardesiacus]